MTGEFGRRPHRKNYSSKIVRSPYKTVIRHPYQRKSRTHGDTSERRTSRLSAALRGADRRAPSAVPAARTDDSTAAAGFSPYPHSRRASMVRTRAPMRRVPSWASRTPAPVGDSITRVPRSRCDHLTGIVASRRRFRRAADFRHGSSRLSKFSASCPSISAVKGVTRRPPATAPGPDAVCTGCGSHSRRRDRAMSARRADVRRSAAPRTTPREERKSHRAHHV